MGTLDTPQQAPAHPSRPSLKWAIALGVVLILIVVASAPLTSWSRTNEQRALSLSNIRRISLGALLYSQDWDGRFMPPVEHRPDGSWLTWVERVRPHVAPDSVFSSPSNPIPFEGSHITDPVTGAPVRASYAFNARFWGTFAPGPFPLENLEIPAQTVLFIEAGPAWKTPFVQGRNVNIARITYGDTMDRLNGLVPYPSTHESRIAVAAADGHAVTVKVAHYDLSNGLHDPLYGRLGGNLYNWNGGHPNGAVDQPARD